jgi:hypothetical protein
MLHKIKLAIYWIRIRAMETTAHGRSDILRFVADHETRSRMLLAQESLMIEIIRLKADRRRMIRGEGLKACSLGAV